VLYLVGLIALAPLFDLVAVRFVLPIFDLFPLPPPSSPGVRPTRASKPPGAPLIGELLLILAAAGSCVACLVGPAALAVLLGFATP
jgi:hypothetical protein